MPTEACNGASLLPVPLKPPPGTPVGGLRTTGTVVSPVITIYAVPDISVLDPDKFGRKGLLRIVVGPMTTSKLPELIGVPGRASSTSLKGIVVAVEIITFVIPPSMSVSPDAGLSGLYMTVVSPEMTTSEGPTAIVGDTKGKAPIPEATM